MPDLNSILQSLTRAQEESRAANEARYADILALLNQNRTDTGQTLNQAEGLMQSRVGGVEDLLRSSGQGAMREAGRRYEENLAAGEQDLIDRGRAGSVTIAGANRRRASEQLGREQADVREATDRARSGAYLQTTGDLGQFMANRAGAQSNLAQGVAGFMERRTDEYPDMGAYADLLRQIEENTAGTPRRTTSITNSTGGGGRGGGGSYGGGAGQSGGSGPSRTGSAGSGGGGSRGGSGFGGGGGGGWGGSGVSTFTNSLGFNPNQVVPGSRLFLGGRALGPGGTLQGVGTTPGGPNLEHGGMVRTQAPGRATQYTSPGLGELVDGGGDGAGGGSQPSTDTPNAAQEGAGGGGGNASGFADPQQSTGAWRDTTYNYPGGHPNFGQEWRVEPTGGNHWQVRL